MGSKITSWYPGCIPCLNNEEVVDEYLNTIKVNLAQNQKVINALRERIKELEDEHYKDKRIKELSESFEKVRADARRGFSISEEESKAIAAWKAKHDAEVHNNPKQYHGCSGGGYEYTFNPTGIGTFGECVCSKCQLKAFRESQGDPVKHSDLLREWGALFEFTEQ